MKRWFAIIASLFFSVVAAAQSSPPLVTVDGQKVTDEDLAPYVQSQLRPLRDQEYQIRKQALDTLITQRILEAEAKKKGITTEKLYAQEVDAKVPEPSDAELSAVYAERAVQPAV
jgi:hypothetical protein